MKKLLLSILSICFLLFSSACTDDTQINTSAIIFTRPECQNTEKALQFFSQIRSKTSLITYQIKDLSLAENRLLIKKFAQKHHIELTQLYTPIIFTPKGYTSGWDDKTSNNLKSLLNIR